MIQNTGILEGKVSFRVNDKRIRKILGDALRRPPGNVPRITSVRSVVLSRHPTRTTVGLTRYSRVRHIIVFSKPRQTITLYVDLLDGLSDRAAEGVIAHELAHAWLNEHVKPEESSKREVEADRLAKQWGFSPELAALDREAETLGAEG